MDIEAEVEKTYIDALTAGLGVLINGRNVPLSELLKPVIPEQDKTQVTGNSQLAWQRMTEAERAKHDEQVRQLDSMLAAKLDRDRRKNVVTIDFAERRIADRRHSER